jgi:hypothetical protein
MGKRVLLAAVVILVVWSALDFVIHGVILRASYEATPQLWRPMAEIKYVVMYVASFIAALCFSGVYGWLIGDKSVATGLTYGLLFGIGTGVAMGYGTYSVMPIPYSMALTWFLGTVVQATVAGALVGLIVKE